GWSARDPEETGRHPHHDPGPALRDLAPQLGPSRLGARGTENVPRGPGLAGRVVRITLERLPFARQSRELARCLQLADPSLHSHLDATEVRLLGLVGQARRSTTAPEEVTATAVGTRTTPYLRASSGRRETSTVTTVRPDARSSASSARQSVHSGGANATPISALAVEGVT